VQSAIGARIVSDPETAASDGDVMPTVRAVGAALTEIKRLNQRVSDLMFALGDGAGWFDRAMRAERERDAAHAAAPPWLADAAEALGEVRSSDGAPLALNWTQVLAAIGDMREDRDEWKKRAESAEYALAPYLCPECKTCLSPKEIEHTMCRKCAEKDMAKMLGGGLLLDLPADWNDSTPDRGPQ